MRGREQNLIMNFWPPTFYHWHDGFSDADMLCDVQRVDLEELMGNCSQNIPGFSDALDAQAVAAKTDGFLANPEEEVVDVPLEGWRPSHCLDTPFFACQTGHALTDSPCSQMRETSCRNST